MISIRALSQNIFVILLTIILIFAIPTVLIILSPLFIVRRLLEHVAKWMDPTLVGMLPPIGTILADQKPYTEPLATFVITFHHSEVVDKTRFQNEFTDKVIRPKSNNGECLYPELKQRIVRRLGYYFWQKVTKFQVDNHIRYADEDDVDRVYNQSDVIRREEMSTKRPFDQNYSPWEFIIVRNFRDPSRPTAKSVVIFRGQHCFMDGYSFMGLLQKLSHAPVQLPVYQNSQVGLLTSTLDSLLNTVRVPYELAQILMNEDNNSWLRKVINSPVGKIRIGHGRLVDINLLKAAKNHYNVSMSSLLYTIYVGGFIKLMKKKKEIVNTVRVAMPVFEQRQKDSLENVFTGFTTTVDIHSESILKTMVGCNQQFQKSKSAQRAFTRLVPAVLGRLPLTLLPDPKRVIKATLPTTIFQGPISSVDYCGYPVEEISSCLTPGPQYAFVSAIYSYNGFIKFTVFGDESVCPTQEDMDIFLSGIDDTINELMQDCPM